MYNVVPLEQFLRSHISPDVKVDPFSTLDPSGQGSLFVYERGKGACRSISDMDAKSPKFWSMLQTLLEEFEQNPWYQRLYKIYVNPQSAVKKRTGINGFSELVGRMNRGAHTDDATSIVIDLMKQQCLQGKNIDSGEIIHTALCSKGHDVEHTGLSHLAQDSLADRGHNVDHDLKIAFGRSQRYMQSLCARWGIDCKEFVVSGLPPEFLCLSREDKLAEWNNFKSQLGNIIFLNPDRWLHYKEKYDLGKSLTGEWKDKLEQDVSLQDCIDEVDTILDLSLDSPDHLLLEDPKWAKISTLVHEDVDESYIRLDHTQSKEAEFLSISLLQNGILKPSSLDSSNLEKISFLQLPKSLRASLGGTRSIPTGELYLTFIHDFEHKNSPRYLCLVEKKGEEFILRAINMQKFDELTDFIDKSEFVDGLIRVKAPKTISRYAERLKFSKPIASSTYEVSDLNVMIRDRASLGDYQSKNVASWDATLGRAFFESAIKLANDGEGVAPIDLIFGTYEDICSQFTDKHKQVLSTGYEESYEPIFRLEPYSSSVGHHWVGPNSPDKHSINDLLEKLKVTVEEFRQQLNEKGYNVEIVDAPSAPVSKIKKMILSEEDSKSQLAQRFGLEQVSNSDTEEWYQRTGRDPDDLFSLGIKIPSKKQLADNNIELEENQVYAELFFRLHRGFVVAMHKDDWQKVELDLITDFQGKIDSILNTYQITIHPNKHSVEQAAVDHLFRRTYF